MTPRIHHFGLLVKNIEKFLEQSIWELRGSIVVDPIQKARLCLVVVSGDMSEPLVELIEPLDATSPTWRATTKGQAWHHMCLRVSSMSAGDAYIEDKRLLAITPWQPAVLFEGRCIRFTCSRNRELLELLSDEIAR
jgi:hypothetical protein